MNKHFIGALSGITFIASIVASLYHYGSYRRSRRQMKKTKPDVIFVWLAVGMGSAYVTYIVLRTAGMPTLLSGRAIP